MKSGQLANPSSHWTIGLTSQWFYLTLFALTLFHLWLSTRLPPVEDELYYWSWSQHLHLSYYDHPPVIALLIRLSTDIFGNNLFGIRFFACVLSSLSIWMMSFLVSDQTLLSYLFLTPLFFVGAIVMTPDIPLVFFWMAYVLWLVSINGTLSQWSDDPITRVYRQSPVSYPRWAVGGFLLGIGLLSKYSMFLAVPCSLVALAVKYRGKGWAAGYFFHLVVAFVVFLPVLIFNFQHNFVPLHFQWNHAMGGFEFSFRRFGEFLGTQILLVGALPFLFLPLLFLKGADLCASPRLYICFWFFVMPFLFFLMHATKANLEANWPIVAYLTFWPLAQGISERSSFAFLHRAVTAVSFLIPAICSVLLVWHCISPLKIILPGQDRISKFRSQLELSKRVAEDVKKMGESPLYLPSYQWTAYFRYQNIPAEQILNAGRASEFTLDSQPVCGKKEILTFEDVTHVPDALNCFPRREVLHLYPLTVRGDVVERYALVRYGRGA